MEPSSRRFSFEDADVDEGESHGGGGLKRLLGAVLYYKWLVIAITVVGTALGVMASGYASLAYTAQARLWVAQPDRNTEMGPIQSSELLEGSGWIELLQSDAVLDYVVRDRRLYLRFRDSDRDVMATFLTDSTFTPGRYTAVVDATAGAVELRTAEGAVLERVRAGAPLGLQLGFQWQPDVSTLTPNREIDFVVIHPQTAARDLAGSIDPNIASLNFLMLRYTSSDPQLSTQVLNTLADRYVDVAAELKRAKLAETRDILETQLVYAEQNLRSAELALESFRVETITLPSDAGTPVNPGTEATTAPALSSFFQLNIDRDALQRDQAAIQRLLENAGEQGISVDALSMVGAVAASPELMQALSDLTTRRAELRALRQTYTDAHPLVERALTNVEHLQGTVVPQLARAVVDNLDAQIAAMDRLVNSASGDLRAIPPRAIDESRLTRAVGLAATLYNELRQRYESARLATETTIPDVRVLDYASVPQFASSNPRLQIMMLGLLGSLALAVGIAVLLERMDPRIRYPEQVSDGLRLAILGAVPNLSKRRWGSGVADRAEAIEALRGVRLSLTHAYGAAGPLMVTVSSPGSGDGKTFLTSNLGLTFADLGRRTLLIDGDTRRGTMHRLLNISRTPGLTDYLAGRAELDDVIRPTANPALDMIPCGLRTAASPELLSSPRMGMLLARVRSTYQVVLIDSPPLGAGVDPLVLATATGHMLIVFRPGTTDRAMAEAKVAMLDRLPVRVLGAVVNGVSSHIGYKYYSYLPGYEAEGDEAGEPAHLLEPA